MLKKIVKAWDMLWNEGIYVTYKHSIKLLRHLWEKRSPYQLKLRYYYNLVRLVFTPNFTNKRILGIWDFKSLPWSIGDPLVFIEKLSILKLENNAEEIDICVIYDREDPLGNRKFGDNKNITPENAQDYMLEFLPLFSTCPYLGSIYQFNNRSEFYRFLNMNIERYNLYPPLNWHLGETYNYYGGSSDFGHIQEFFNDNGYIPYLMIREREQGWSRWFYATHLKKNSIPVSLSLKQTLHAPERNANPQVWLQFIDKCKMDFPEVIFVIVGLREEIFDGLRERSNIIIAKDFGTSITEDFALIRTSIMYMATASGINSIVNFSDLPYLIFQVEISSMQKYGLKDGEKYSFFTNKQEMFSADVPVTEELLFNEFKELYLKLDQNEWRETTLKQARYKHSHPTTSVKVDENGNCNEKDFEQRKSQERLR